jgi:hypothetical protein
MSTRDAGASATGARLKCYGHVMQAIRSRPTHARTSRPRAHAGRPRARISRAAVPRAPAALACAALVTSLAIAPAAVGDTAAPSARSSSARRAQVAGGVAASQGTGAGARTNTTATLEQCATATAPQSERSATFAGEMTAIPGAARMEMRIDVLERTPEEAQYHKVSAPGLGVWRSSDAGVKIYTYIKQVTNLSAPALYRGAVHFRWLNARGHAIKYEVLHTAACEQPAPEPTAGAGAGADGDAGSGGEPPAASSLS